MLDIKFVRENPEKVKENIKKKFQDKKLGLVDEVIALDSEYREVKVKADELASLPKGSVIVYDANEICKNEKGETKHICEDGHVTVALGNGKACSDELEDEILKTDRSYVFIPV